MIIPDKYFESTFCFQHSRSHCQNTAPKNKVTSLKRLHPYIYPPEIDGPRCVFQPIRGREPLARDSATQTSWVNAIVFRREWKQDNACDEPSMNLPRTVFSVTLLSGGAYRSVPKRTGECRCKKEKKEKKNSIKFLKCAFKASCYSTRLSWAHTPVINWGKNLIKT